MRIPSVLVAAIMFSAAAMLPAPDAQAAPPARFRYQARLVDFAGLPLAGIHTLTLGVYAGGTANTAGSGTKLYEETVTLTGNGGVFSTSLGAGTATFGALTPATLQSAGASDVFVQAAVDGASNVVLPRTRLDSVPFALASAGDDPRTPLNPIGLTLPIPIDKPGSYYLTGNLVATEAAIGIQITTAGVTLDLNGFLLDGGGVGTIGILATANAATVVNGNLANWAIVGILCNGQTAVATDLRVADCASAGIFMAGKDCSATRCTVTGVANNQSGDKAYGISLEGDNSTLKDCNVSDWAPSGVTSAFAIKAGNRGTIVDCKAVDNVATGGATMFGISASDYSLIDRCVGTGNDVDGDGSVTGIAAGSQSKVSACAASYNGFQKLRNGTAMGIRVDGYSLVTDCQAANQYPNGSNYTGIGIYATDYSTVRGCVATANRGNGTGFGAGIGADVGVLVEGNSCFGNAGTKGYGVLVGNAANFPAFGGARAMVLGNRLSDNQTASVGVRSPKATPSYIGRNLTAGTTLVENPSAAIYDAILGTGPEANINF